MPEPQPPAMELGSLGEGPGHQYLLKLRSESVVQPGLRTTASFVVIFNCNRVEDIRVFQSNNGKSCIVRLLFHLHAHRFE